MYAPDRIALLLTMEIPWRKQQQREEKSSRYKHRLTKASRKHAQFPIKLYSVSWELQAARADDKSYLDRPHTIIQQDDLSKPPCVRASILRVNACIKALHSCPWCWECVWTHDWHTVWHNACERWHMRVIVCPSVAVLAAVCIKRNAVQTCSFQLETHRAASAGPLTVHTHTRLLFTHISTAGKQKGHVRAGRIAGKCRPAWCGKREYGTRQRERRSKKACKCYSLGKLL